MAGHRPWSGAARYVFASPGPASRRRRPLRAKVSRCAMYRRHALVLLTVAIAGCAAAPSQASTDWVISIEVKAPGRSPKDVEAQVTTPLENALNNLPGVVRLMSRTFEGACSFEVSFAARPTEAQLKSVSQVIQSELARSAPGLPAPTVAIRKRRR